MRDTKALQDARANEPDPYKRRFGMPKWNRTITVADDHRLFARLPEFAGWTRAEHLARATSQLSHAITCKLQWRRQVETALQAFGDGSGVLISGIVRDHFPGEVKDRLRELAQRSTSLQDTAYAHWRAAGKTMSTYRQEIDRLQGRTTDDRPIGQRTRAEV